MIQTTRDQWDFIDRLPYPWLVALAEKLRLLDFPNLAGPTLAIYSDYSGSSRESRFNTISLLFIDMERVQQWNEMRKAVRQQYLADGRRMEFKGLNDGYRRRALPWFLRAADRIPGCCVAIGIDKRINGVLIKKDMVSEVRQRAGLEATWSFKSLDSMLRVVQFVAMFTALFSHPGQNNYWISDEDELFAGPKAMDTKRMTEKFTSMYIPFPLGELGLGTTKIDEADRFDEDCAAVTDLVAGATAEVLSCILTTAKEIPNLPRLAVMPDQISRKSDLITDWFSSQHGMLRKCGAVISMVTPGHYRVGTWGVDDAIIHLP
jgi:hypothetical protein